MEIYMWQLSSIICIWSILYLSVYPVLRACGSFHDFHETKGVAANKEVTEPWEFLVVKLKKHCTENKRSSNTNTTKNRCCTQVLRKGKQFLLHMWHPLCYLTRKLLNHGNS
jgi:hypothetical protein